MLLLLYDQSSYAAAVPASLGTILASCFTPNPNPPRKNPLHSNKHYILQEESVCGSQGTSCRAYNASFCYFVKPFSPPQARTPAHAPEPTDKGSKIIGNTPKCHLVLLSLSLQLPNCVPISGATLVNP